jgi:hypothetical protein
MQCLFPVKSLTASSNFQHIQVLSLSKSTRSFPWSHHCFPARGRCFFDGTVGWVTLSSWLSFSRLYHHCFWGWKKKKWLLWFGYEEDLQKGSFVEGLVPNGTTERWLDHKGANFISGPLGGGAWLQEVGHWGAGCLWRMCLALDLPIWLSLLPDSHEVSSLCHTEPAAMVFCITSGPKPWMQLTLDWNYFSQVFITLTKN